MKYEIHEPKNLLAKKDRCLVKYSYHVFQSLSNILQVLSQILRPKMLV